MFITQNHPLGIMTKFEIEKSKKYNARNFLKQDNFQSVSHSKSFSLATLVLDQAQLICYLQHM